MAAIITKSAFSQEKKSAILEEFHKFIALDDEMCRQERYLVLSIISASKSFAIHKGMIKNSNFVGSLAEGCTLPRVFKINNRFSDAINREIELDLDFKLLDVPEEFQSSFKDVEEKRGIVRIDPSNLPVFSLAKDIGWDVSEEDTQKYDEKIVSKDGCIQPYKLKYEGGEKLELKNNNRLIQLIIAAATREKRKNVSLTVKPNTIRKAAITSDFMVDIRCQPILDLSIDFAIIIQIKWWPDIYSEFKSRKREWPSQEIIDELTSYCNVIAKPSDEELSNHETTEFRYSFAHLERLLVSMRSKQQTLVYFVFKSLYVKHIKNLNIGEADDGGLSTFLCKNTMFWVCERFNPNHEIWNCDFDAIYHAINLLLNEMLQCFQSGIMPYYFDSKVNLLSKMSDDMKLAASCKIQNILVNPDQYLEFNMEKELNVCKELFKFVSSVSEVFDEIQKKDYTRILKQPELIPDVIAYFIRTSDIKQSVLDELERVGKQVEAEVKRSGKKVEAEASRVGKRVEAEVKRSGKKVEAEASRVGKRVEAEVKRNGGKIEAEASRVGNQVENEVKRSGKKIEAEIKRFKKRGFRF